MIPIEDFLTRLASDHNSRLTNQGDEERKTSMI